jgi:hypothetical protein
VILWIIDIETVALQSSGCYVLERKQLTNYVLAWNWNNSVELQLT